MPVPVLSPTHSGRRRPSAAFVLPVHAALPRRLPYPVVFLLSVLLPATACAHNQWPYGQQSGESMPQNRVRHDIDPACRKSSGKYPASPLRLPAHCLQYVSRSDKPMGQTVDTSPAATGDTVSGIRLLNPELNHPFLFLFSIYKTKVSNQRLQNRIRIWEIIFQTTQKHKKRRAIADTPSYIRNKLKTYFTITFTRFTSEPLSKTTT